MKRIVVDHGICKQLQAEGYGSQPTIRKALRCESNTESARKIRQRALQLGGVVMETEKVKMVVGAAGKGAATEQRIGA